MPAPYDLTDQEFGRLTVIRLATAQERGKTPGRWWWCSCTCGNEVAVAGRWLTSNRPGHRTRSCGCLRSEEAAKHARTDLNVPGVAHRFTEEERQRGREAARKAKRRPRR